MDTTHVPAGYKLTDLGVLPEDWAAAPFSQFATPNKSKYNPATSSTSFLCIELEHLEQGSGALNGATDSLRQKSLKSVFKKGSVLFGKLRPYLKKYYFADFEGVCSTEIWSLDNNTLTDSRYLYYLVQSDTFIETANNTTGTRMPRASWPDVAKALFPLPPLPEQQAIAAALGEVDALLAAQRARLEKQRAVKQGLLQGLLSGEKRLPGFAGEWEVNELGKYVQINSGMSPSLFHLLNQGKPYFKVEQLNCNGAYLYDTPYYINSSYGVAAGSIIFPKRGASIMLNKIKILKQDSFMDTNLMTLTATSGVNNIYLYYWLSLYNLSQVADTTSIPQINNKHIKPIPFPLPSPEEQKAIAAVLSEADAAIEALEAEHAKTQLLKQGLMQNLLIGKLRLI